MMKCLALLPVSTSIKYSILVLTEMKIVKFLKFWFYVLAFLFFFHLSWKKWNL